MPWALSWVSRSCLKGSTWKSFESKFKFFTTLTFFMTRRHLINFSIFQPHKNVTWCVCHQCVKNKHPSTYGENENLIFHEAFNEFLCSEIFSGVFFDLFLGGWPFRLGKWNNWKIRMGFKGGNKPLDWPHLQLLLNHLKIANSSINLISLQKIKKLYIKFSLKIICENPLMKLH